MLQGQCAIVTGSTSGIGLGIARSLGASGAPLMLNGFGDPAQVESLRAGLEREFAVRVGYSAPTCRSPSRSGRWWPRQGARLGRHPRQQRRHSARLADRDFPSGRWDAVLAINLSSVFHAVQASLPGVKARNWGRFVNIASAHGLVASVKK